MNDPTDCDCCAGIDTQTPKPLYNRPALPAIAYRVGSHSEFKESMLARLSSSDYPALRTLTARDDGDFGVALCDAAAVVLDVLSFYQERIANENFLRTAHEQGSILELARLIGYQLSSGIAASTALAFTLQEAPGLPSASAEPVTISIGTRVQSVPGPDEQAQSFETIEAIEARVEWNAMSVQTSLAWQPRWGDTEMYLAGVATSLQVGDAILIVGQERQRDTGSENWDIRVVSTVEADSVRNRTRIAWLDGLGHIAPYILPAAEAPKVYVLRQRAALFGHNAPDPRLMGQRGSDLLSVTELTENGRKWKNYVIKATNIDLDAAYPKIIANSWFALISNEANVGSPSLPGYVELYRAKTVSTISRTDFALSGKITRIVPDTTENLSSTRYSISNTLVLAQSEVLQAAARPILYPLIGSSIVLASVQIDLAPGRPLAVTGKRQRIVLADQAKGLMMTLTTGGTVALSAGDSLRLDAPPEQLIASAVYALSAEDFGAVLATTTLLRLQLRDRDNLVGTLDVQANLIRLQAALKDDETLAEIVYIDDQDSAVTHARDATTLLLEKSLSHVYERESVRISANVASATHGETVSETLGSGDVASANQSFLLRQAPLTHISAATPSGRAATLELRVNDILWREVPFMYGQAAAEQVYTLASDESGRSRVVFGDGIEGARLPSGQDNLRARYRKGLGVAGNIAAGKLSNLLSRPHGVNGVINPVLTSGGQDAESGDAARENAPLVVLTLDRAVSVQDYEDFSRSFAGIAKAHAAWVAAGPGRGVFITVSGEDSASVPEGSDTYRNLLTALRQYGDPLLPLRLASYRDAKFTLRAAVKVAAAAEIDLVLENADAALRNAFSFQARRFGQMVSVDEIMTVLHTIVGVEAVNVLHLYRPDQGMTARLEPRLFARLPETSLTTLPEAAELLLLDASAIELEVMV